MFPVLFLLDQECERDYEKLLDHGIEFLEANME